MAAETSSAEVLEKSGNVANKLAPDTRRIWKWVLAAQGAAVVTPLMWLVLVRLHWPASYTAFFVTLSTLAIITICWWLRWKGMQHTWTRARVIAEIARSLGTTQSIDSGITTRALSAAPELQKISQWLAQGSSKDSETTLPTKCQSYRENRIRDQLNYYKSKHAEAEASRHRLNKVVTVALDTALFLAISGIIISTSDKGLSWLEWSHSDFLLGALGVVLPLIAILAQMQGGYLELNRRIGRYAQQIKFLEPAEARLADVDNEQELKDHMLDVERSLLNEVVDWYYQTEHAQMYYRNAAKNMNARHIRRATAIRELSPFNAFFFRLRTATDFLFKVVVGRILVGAISVILTTAYISFQENPDNAMHSGGLVDTNRLLENLAQKNSDDAWNPALSPTIRQQAANGFILIAHGLDDYVGKNGDLAGAPEAWHWMVRMQYEIERQFDDPVRPEVVLVDWEKSASPSEEQLARTDATQSISKALATTLPKQPREFLYRLVTIRTQGSEVGEMVGYKLARAIRRGQIDPEKPMHFIGHSAGGFVVMHAAIVLQELGLKPVNLRITILDTPIPKWRDLAKVARHYKVDFYRSSKFTGLEIPDSDWHPNYTRFDIPLPDDGSIDPFMDAHSYAHQWFIESIINKDAEGFDRSPLFSD